MRSDPVLAAATMALMVVGLMCSCLTDDEAHLSSAAADEGGPCPVAIAVSPELVDIVERAASLWEDSTPCRFYLRSNGLEVREAAHGGLDLGGRLNVEYAGDASDWTAESISLRPGMGDLEAIVVLAHAFGHVLHLDHSTLPRDYRVGNLPQSAIDAVCEQAGGCQ